MRWSSRRLSLLLAVLALLIWPRAARAHDLALDQLMLWPDRVHGTLRGELTLDPELTRDKRAAPTPQHEALLLELLRRELALALDGQRLQPEYRIRELWVAGGATLGDLVIFTLPLPGAASELRVGTGAALKALIVSVQVPNGRSADTASWLLRANDTSPAYTLGRAGELSGWTRGGPEAFEARARAARDGSGSSSTALAPPAADRALEARGTSGLEPPGEAASMATLALRFVRLGVEHILPGGLDHVLFIAGLVLSAGRRYRRVLISLSLFTLAHSVTLALGHFGLVNLPARWVEPGIALSIATLGVLSFRAWRTGQRPHAGHALVFAFGLLHGLGFASALGSIAFDREHVVLALAAFNVGVELGQVAVVLLLVLALGITTRNDLARRYAIPVGSLAIAVSGVVLTLSRLPIYPAAAAALSALETSR